MLKGIHRSDDNYHHKEMQKYCWCKHKNRCNHYVTTLHCINSAIIKLSKLTKPTLVYRGVSDRGLPRQVS